MKTTLKRSDLLYPDLCYQIVGTLFEAWKNVGPGHKEKFYQKAVAKEFEIKGIKFREQLPVKINYKNKNLGIYYFDFLVEDIVVLEIKVRNYFSKNDIDQLYSYLKAKGLQLGMITHFTKTGAKFKRVVNIIQ